MAEKPNTGSENMYGMAILAGVLFALILLFWHFQADNVRSLVRWLRVGEMWATSLVLGDDYKVMDGDKYLGKLGSIRDKVSTIPKTQLTPEIMDIIAVSSLYPIRLIFTTILLLLALWALYYGPKCGFRSKLDLNRLIKRQSGNFSILSPFITFNPSNQPPRPPGAPVPADLPSFAEALGPEEWLAYNVVPIHNNKIDEVIAARAFAKQLGGAWRGPMNLSPERQVLLAAMCLKAARKRSESDDMLGRLSKCWTFEKGLKLDSSLVREARKILKSRDLSGKTLAKCNQHAYENTALLRALLTAREEGGVLAPAQFLWLRGYDRNLWYPLNNLGRQAFHMEALGAMCHYKAEKMAQRPIPRPKMEDAVRSIVDYMASSNARPVPPLDYSKSKKSGIKKVKGS